MWNKRKEEENQPKPAAAPAAPASVVKETPPMSTAPAMSYTPSSETRGPAVIGKSVMIKGQIFSREDLTIDGEVDGSVELHEHRLTVGPNGKLQAGVKAREVVVLGTIHGNVEASDKIDIRKDAKLVGDIKTSRIVIEDGAYFKGSIDIVRAEANKSAPQQQAKPATPAPPPPTAASVAAASAPAASVAGDSKR